ncbi:hypothetical protein KR074_006844 [Drosophila pseudoananassae]|nr:hypothetical protein KR074_006844 [Drosophila pseudoananassae]
MPAGIVKTPNSNGNGNQKTAERNSSGKKFVQTRLPFKLITPGGSAPGAAAPSSGAPEAETQEPRKRKLSYEEDGATEGTSTSEDHLRRSTSKENLNVTGPAATKKAKTTEADEDVMAEDVIELDDDEDEVVPVKEVAEATEPKATKPAKKSLPKDKQNSSKAKEKLTASKSKESKSSPAPPIQIKLPLGNKRPKRRKSLKKSDETVDISPIDSSKPGSESSDDIEAIAEELNPQKKPKVQENNDEDDVVELLDDDAEENEEDVEKGKEASKDTKKTEGNKKSIMDLFASKKGDSKKKVEKENTKKDEESAGGEEKKVEAETKPAEKPKKNSKKSPTKPDSPKDAKEEATTEKNSKEEKKVLSNEKKSTAQETIEETKPTEKSKKNAEKSPKDQENSKDATTQSQEKPSEEEAKKATDISVLLSSSENEQSSSDHEMEVDTDTPARSMHKDTPSRRSLPEASDGPQKNLTPKQQRLLEQRKKAREEKEQKLAQERRLKQVEKEQREQQKKQEREEKEQQRKLEKDQKEQQKKLEREEKERKRQAEVDTKNEEKRKRNEAKEEVQRKKDEERRKKEQEREEAEQKKKRAAESFSKFFVPKQPKSGAGASATSYLEHEQSSCDSTKASSQTLAFRPFQIKDDMLLAPVIRANLGQEQRSQLDGLFREKQEDGDDEDEDEDIGRRKRPNRAHLYLSELNNGRRKPLQMQRDTRLQRRTKDEEDEDEVQVIGEPDCLPIRHLLAHFFLSTPDDLSTAGLPIEEEQPKQLARMRAKYLHFADNRRPPYYGTWRKKSCTISARRPLAQDKKLFDYELDSDCEWEEEEPGESLSASEDEKERESEEESEEEYNEWYVPHGHLSDEELQNDGEMDDGHTREAQKAKLQVLQQEFAQEMKKQTKKIKPRLLGPVWLDENGNKSELFPAMFAHTIDMYACWQVAPLGLEPPPEPEREDQPPEAPLPLQLDERLLQQLVRLTHGNRNSKVFLINEYLEYLKTQEGGGEGAILPSKTLVREKFDELASWKPVELTTPDLNTSASSAKKAKKPKKRLCWVVPPEILEKFHLPDLSLQNQWDYTLTPKITEGPDAQQHELSPPAEATEATASPTVATATATPTSSGATTPNTGGATKKRATLLMSVPRDQPIQTAAKNALISQFLRRRSDSAGGNPGKDKDATPAKPKGKERPATVCEDVVMLSD